MPKPGPDEEPPKPQDSDAMREEHARLLKQIQDAHRKLKEARERIAELERKTRKRKE